MYVIHATERGPRTQEMSWWHWFEHALIGLVWCDVCICVYMCVWERERERESVCGWITQPRSPIRGADGHDVQVSMCCATVTARTVFVRTIHRHDVVWCDVMCYDVMCYDVMMCCACWWSEKWEGGESLFICCYKSGKVFQVWFSGLKPSNVWIRYTYSDYVEWYWLHKYTLHTCSIQLIDLLCYYRHAKKNITVLWPRTYSRSGRTRANIEWNKQASKIPYYSNTFLDLKFKSGVKQEVWWCMYVYYIVSHNIVCVICNILYSCDNISACTHFHIHIHTHDAHRLKQAL